MASTAENATEDQKKPNRPELRYGDGDCKRCRELDKLKLEPKPDDHDYIYESDDFEGDEELMLRVIHYRRTIDVAGCFDVVCPPPGYGYIYPLEHFRRKDRDFKKRIQKGVKFVVDTYNQEKGQDLILLDVRNVNVRHSGCWLIFYVIFEGFNQCRCKPTDTSYIQIYQTKVSYTTWRWRFPDYKIHILRKRNSNGKDEDLLPPDSD